MNRRQFLERIGIGAAGLASLAVVGADDTPEPDLQEAIDALEASAQASDHAAESLGYMAQQAYEFGHRVEMQGDLYEVVASSETAPALAQQLSAGVADELADDSFVDAELLAMDTLAHWDVDELKAADLVLEVPYRAVYQVKVFTLSGTRGVEVSAEFALDLRERGKTGWCPLTKSLDWSDGSVLEVRPHSPHV